MATDETTHETSLGSASLLRVEGSSLAPPEALQASAASMMPPLGNVSANDELGILPAAGASTMDPNAQVFELSTGEQQQEMGMFGDGSYGMCVIRVIECTITRHLIKC